MGYGHVPADITYTSPPPNNNAQPGAKQTHTNNGKRHMNLYYCYTCGYDVDHPGIACPMRRKQGHCDVPRDQAHLCPGALMVAQHKTMPDGTGAGKGWILARAHQKSKFCHGLEGNLVTKAKPTAALLLTGMGGK